MAKVFPYQSLPAPPGLEESSSSFGSGLSQDAREVGRLNARRHEAGEDYWRVIGETLERIHVVPRQDLHTPENHELPVDFRRILPTGETLVKFGNAYSEYVDDWTFVSGSSSLSAHLPSVQAPLDRIDKISFGSRKGLNSFRREEIRGLLDKGEELVDQSAHCAATGTFHSDRYQTRSRRCKLEVSHTHFVF